MNIARAKYDKPKQAEISVETIRTWAKRGSCNVAHPGLTSPMEEVEDYIVEIMTQLAEMQVPITCHQGLELANSLILETSTAKKVMTGKK